MRGGYQALILVGGLGKRLRPLTENIPKPMVNVRGRPFLELKLEHLKRYGIEDIVFCVGYLGNKVEEHFGNGKKFGMNINYSYEKELLGTGGAIKNAENLIRGDFLAMNGDSFIELNMDIFLQFHERQNSPVTMAVVPATNAKEQELVESRGNRVFNFYKRDTPEHAEYLRKTESPLVNGGVYAIKKEILFLIPGGREVSIEKEIFPGLKEKINTFYFDGYFKDIGNFRDYQKFKEDLKHGKSL